MNVQIITDPSAVCSGPRPRCRGSARPDSRSHSRHHRRPHRNRPSSASPTREGVRTTVPSTHSTLKLSNVTCTNPSRRAGPGGSPPTRPTTGAAPRAGCSSLATRSANEASCPPSPAAAPGTAPGWAPTPVGDRANLRPAARLPAAAHPLGTRDRHVRSPSQAGVRASRMGCGAATVTRALRSISLGSDRSWRWVIRQRAGL
jgi:hypothetical protein